MEAAVKFWFLRDAPPPINSDDDAQRSRAADGATPDASQSHDAQADGSTSQTDIVPHTPAGQADHAAAVATATATAAVGAGAGAERSAETEESAAGGDFGRAFAAHVRLGQWEAARAALGRLVETHASLVRSALRLLVVRPATARW